MQNSPPPLFAYEHDGRTYRIELVLGSARQDPSPDRSFWRVRRGSGDVLIAPYQADEAMEALRVRLGRLLGGPAASIDPPPIASLRPIHGA